MTIETLITGFPRIGEHRELKYVLERYWSGKGSEAELKETAAALRRKNWLLQRKNGIDLISINDFSLYDHVLDTAVLLGAIPARFRCINDPLRHYFSMARGNGRAAAMEMTKWFNTNYHYIVPELSPGMTFALNTHKIRTEYSEARALGIPVKINLVGPLTFLGISKMTDGSSPFVLAAPLLAIYERLLRVLSDFDAEMYIHIDESYFVKEVPRRHLDLLGDAYRRLGSVSEKLRIIVSTGYGHSCEATAVLADTPVWGIGLDLVYGKKNMESLPRIRDKKLIAGVIDGRNIWISDFGRTAAELENIAAVVGRERVVVATSCSLLHVPYSVETEPQSAIRRWLSFAAEKTAEVAIVNKLFRNRTLSPQEQEYAEHNRCFNGERKVSPLLHNETVRKTVSALRGIERKGSTEERRKRHQESFGLPVLPTTTIGSFPQTPEIRRLRRLMKSGTISLQQYEEGMKQCIDYCIAVQEKIGLDVLVHGEPERNDMVEYFGEMLGGFQITENGWVQSYGSRCVKPPVIFGDVFRSAPMTVKWIGYAQSRTRKIVKGMLTGPVTMLNWSFIRDDLPRADVCAQIAIALREEITDLQQAGIRMIQVDEAAFKEGYPLRKADIAVYEKWAVDNFKLAVSTASADTQIHTHMCYSEFGDIIDAIKAMDADVITIETARSGNKLINSFRETAYGGAIGPGVYDIHSPRIPDIEEFIGQITERLKIAPVDQLWINPDCGLKTRQWEEVTLALGNMVSAVKKVRARLDGSEYRKPRYII